MGGDQKGLSIFFIFEYINGKNVLILNMASKVVYGFFVRSYDHFKFQSSEIKSDFPSGKLLDFLSEVSSAKNGSLPS